MTNDAFTQLVGQYERFVFTICYQMVRDYHEAQNLTQDTFFSAYRHIDDCPAESYRPWLARIASNKAKDFLKSAYARRVQVREDEQLALLPSDDSPELLCISGETQQYIRDAIESLREPYRNACILYFLEEKSVEEIAQLLHRPKKTVQTQIYRAKLLLQQQLKEERRV